MAQNVAAQDLANLQRAAGSTINVAREQRDIVGNARRRVIENTSRSEQESGEADFSLPEAIVTGVASSFILGPLGGVLLGLGQGVLGQKAKQNALDAAFAENEAINTSVDAVYNQIEAFRNSAVNPNDSEQLDAMETKLRVGVELAKLGRTDQAMSVLGALTNDLGAYANRQEDDRIAREEFAYRQGQDALNRYDSNLASYDTASQGFMDMMASTDLVLESIEKGTPLDQALALTKFQTIVDDLGQVRDEDVARWGGQEGGLFQQLDGYLKKLATGEELTPQEQRDLQEATLRIRNNVMKQQRETDLRYLKEGEIYKFTDRMQDAFARSSDYVPYKPTLVDPGPEGRDMDQSNREVFQQQLEADAIGNRVDLGAFKKLWDTSVNWWDETVNEPLKERARRRPNTND